MCTIYACSSEKCVLESFFSSHAHSIYQTADTKLYITVKSTEWKMMFQTLLLSFVTNFGWNPILWCHSCKPYSRTKSPYQPLKTHSKLQLSIYSSQIPFSHFSRPYSDKRRNIKSLPCAIRLFFISSRSRCSDYFEKTQNTRTYEAVILLHINIFLNIIKINKFWEIYIIK